MQPAGARASVRLYLEEALGIRKDVPDPYYGGNSHFEEVYQLCDKASAGLLKALIKL